MSYKTSYSKEEWEHLMKGPYFAGSYVSLADAHRLDQRRERQEMVKEATLWEIPEAARDLIRPLYADIGKYREDTEEIPGYEEDVAHDVQRANSIMGLKESMSILQEKATSEEIEAYRDWLLFVAQKTAESSKEGVFGVFGPRVSQKEEDALQEIRDALGAA